MLKSEVKLKIRNSYESLIDYCHDPDLKFMHLTRLHYLITLAIASAPVEGISFENICSDLDRKISSRSTIQNVLEAGLMADFFEKSTSKADKRVQLYTLTPHAEEQMLRLFDRKKPVFIIDNNSIHDFAQRG